ncbi:hypothetical protein EUGRSUZ_H04872 [Eucalyptus grandis]|uniref:Uncharacterized protein n=2 Tax=Eucalyptus grandis TaxID=71139 RepID=A0ACC3JYG1_EUCGR|nr:hypothetical protein EUGRSUZ_H04872 [Eucalyptus grandis]
MEKALFFMSRFSVSESIDVIANERRLLQIQASGKSAPMYYIHKHHEPIIKQSKHNKPRKQKQNNHHLKANKNCPTTTYAKQQTIPSWC